MSIFSRITRAAFLAFFATALISTVALADTEASADRKQDADTVLAVVGDQKILQKDVDDILNSLQPQQRAYYASPEGRRQIVENLVDAELLYLWGRDSDVQKDEKYQKTLEQLEKRLTTQFAAEKLVSGIEVSEEEMGKYYADHKDSYATPAQVKASHILIQPEKKDDEESLKKAEKRAEEVLKEMAAGLSFEDAAKKYSSCPSKSRGGDLGFFSRGQMVPEFEKAAFAMKKDEVSSAPVKTQFGYHIIKVTGSKPASTKKLEEVREQIRQQLLQGKQKDVFESKIAELKKKHDVRIMLSEEKKVEEKEKSESK